MCPVLFFDGRQESSAIKTRRGILLEIGLQLFVELGTLFPHLPGLLEEGLGRDREELCRVGGAVFIKNSLLSPSVHVDQLFVFFRHDLDPGGMLLSAVQRRGSIDEIIQHVQLVGELVDDDVSAILPIGSTLSGALPGESDNIDIGVGGAENLCFALDDNPARSASSRGDLVGGRVNEDLINPPVEMMLDSKEGKGCLRRDRYLDLVRDLKTIKSSPALVFDEGAGVGEKAFLLCFCKRGVKR